MDCDEDNHNDNSTISGQHSSVDSGFGGGGMGENETNQQPGPDAPERLPQGIPINQISALTFNDVKQDMILRLMDTGHPEDQELAQRAANATTLDELWSISNSKRTVSMNTGQLFCKSQDEQEMSDFNTRISNDLKNAKNADYQQMINEERKRAMEKFAIRDAKTGQLQLPKSLGKEQIEELQKDHNIFVAKELDPETFSDLMRLTNFAPRAMPIKASAAADGEEGAQVDDSAAVEEMEAEIDSRAQQVTEARRWHINAITQTTTEEAPFIGCDLEKIEWLQKCENWRDYFPLTDARIDDAIKKRAGNLRLAITWLPCYSTVVYTPKLLFLLKKQKASHAVSFFSVYQLYDAVLHFLLSTNLRPSHAEFLKNQENLIENLKRTANLEMKEAGIKFVVAHSKGVKWAKEALAENPPRITTPYMGLLQLGHDPVTGVGFTIDSIPQHSADEVAYFVNAQKKQRHQCFMDNLEQLEARRRANEITLAQFIESYYMINHSFCVELLNVYEYAIMWMYEDVIPIGARSDLRTQPDTVKANQVDGELGELVAAEREMYSTLRDYAHRQIQENTPSDQVSNEGIKIHYTALPRQGTAKIDAQLGECSPTYMELAKFYRSISIKYEKAEVFAKVADCSNDLFKKMDSEGGAGEDFNRFLQDQELKAIGNSSGRGGKRSKK